jgi:hypothetical protein
VHLRTACNEKGTATKEGFPFKSFIKNHLMGGWVSLSMLEEDRGSKGFFRCGSPFVAKLRWELSSEASPQTDKLNLDTKPNSHKNISFVTVQFCVPKNLLCL